MVNRLKGTMGEIVHPDQTCGVPGRRVADSLALIRDTIQYITDQNINAALVCLDQTGKDPRYLVWETRSSGKKLERTPGQSQAETGLLELETPEHLRKGSGAQERRTARAAVCDTGLATPGQRITGCLLLNLASPHVTLLYSTLAPILSNGQDSERTKKTKGDPLSENLEKGEKCYSFFFKKIHSAHTLLVQLRNREGILCDTKEDIRKAVTDFYGDLYSEKRSDGDQAEKFLAGIPRKVSTPAREVLNAPLTLEELHIAVKSFKSGKTPGSDGLPIGFYTSLWDLVRPDQTNAGFRTPSRTASLSGSGRTGHRFGLEETTANHLESPF
ncbi:hypothetical protein NDU88_007329 [Pleurodeles waltl]|uniref:Uncharacterized protein n=1 Tax=Pleurodeles waltl TaxID=8319 RepID=A0AAV7SS67_PLEWA|nr:hypothetical protein NDU88_007329 [Pleurodeles waltl]